MTSAHLPPPLERRDRAIVLVHGAWVGEWSWSPVLPLLAASGRPVVNVSLTGHGARSHESGPHVTQADHVDDVVGAITTFDLRRVTLVGHSYGGRVISAASHLVADRLERLVFLD
ncbi:MAG: alpha/beta fold hydrolase, partial [Acidimicrobiia bacterium]